MLIAPTLIPSVIQQYPRFDLDGRSMVTIPGGVAAMGSFWVDLENGDAKPHMMALDSFSVGVHHVTEKDYRRIVGKPGNPKAESLQHPVTSISARDAAHYIAQANQGKREFEQIRLLTEAQIEYMTRGPVVDVRELMETLGISNAQSLMEYLHPRKDHGWELENFVGELALGAQIIATPYHASYRDAFVKLIDSSSPVFAWRVHGTRFGRLNLSYHVLKSGPAPVSLTKRLNAYGISDAMGNVWSWTADEYDKNAYKKREGEVLDPSEELWPDDQPGVVLRGASWFERNLMDLFAGHRDIGHIDHSNTAIGLRVGALPREN